MNTNRISEVEGAQDFDRHCSSFFFDFSTVMNRCDSLRRHPERVALICQAQVRQIAPRELLIPKNNGFQLVVRTRFGTAAETLAGEINVALLRRLFGAECASEIAPIFKRVKRGKIVRLGRSSILSNKPTVQGTEHREPDAPALPSLARIPLGWTDFKPGLLPIYNLQRQTLPIYLCGPVSSRDGRDLFGGDALRYCHPQYRPSVDIAMLEFSLKMLPQVRRGKLASAIATGVSYETLAWSRSRQLYQDALQATELSDNPHLAIKIDDVPDGTPFWRISEIIATVKPLAKRVFVELSHCDSSLKRGGCVGAEGFCASIRPGMESREIAAIASRVKYVAAAQRALSCVFGAEDSTVLVLLRDTGIGLAAKHPHHSGVCFGGLPRLDTSSSNRAA